MFNTFSTISQQLFNAFSIHQQYGKSQEFIIIFCTIRDILKQSQLIFTGWNCGEVEYVCIYWATARFHINLCIYVWWQRSLFSSHYFHIRLSRLSLIRLFIFLFWLDLLSFFFWTISLPALRTQSPIWTMHPISSMQNLAAWMVVNEKKITYKGVKKVVRKSS